jgi:hypothetical protein
MAAALLSRRAYARSRGVVEGTVRKAILAGKIIPTAGGQVDPEQADRNWYRWSRVAEPGQPAAAEPVAEPAEARNGGPPASRPSGRNGGSARSVAAPDDGGLLARLADELHRDEMSSWPAVDREAHHFPVSGGALDLDRMTGNIAKVIADGLDREGGMLAQVLGGIDERLIALEQRIVSNDLAASLARTEALLTGQAEGTRHRLDVIAERIQRLIAILVRHAERG